MSRNYLKVLNRIFGSALTLLFAFIVTQAFLQWMICEMARACGYDTTFTFNEAIVPMDFRLWVPGKVLVVDFIPPVVSLLIGLYLYYTMANQEEPWGIFQLLAYWFMICFINVCLSQLLFAPLGVSDTQSVFYETFARVAPWYRLPPAMSLVLSIAAIIATIGAGYYFSTETVKLSYSQRLVNHNSGKNRLVFEFFVVPLLLCVWPIMLLAKGMVALRMGVIMLNMLLFPAGMLLRNSIGPYSVRFKKMRVGRSFPFLELALGASAWCVIYFFYR